MFTGNIKQLPEQNYLAAPLLAAIKMVLNALKEPQPLGKTELIAGSINYTLVEGECSPAEEKLAEIHHDHIDVHLVLEGVEQIGYSNQALQVTDDSNANIDLYFGNINHENHVTLNAGDFAIFYPYEAHKPMSSYDNQAHKLKKVIIKIRMDKL